MGARSGEGTARPVCSIIVSTPYVSFLNQKGGVWKSTLSVAACLAGRGRVLLIDADKQGTSSTWASLREASPFQSPALMPTLSG
jgi:cellulose biosynthesis protein BcsQ